MKEARAGRTSVLSSDDLGELGETRVQSLCVAAGIAVNRVQRDKYGWDMLIEVPTHDGPPRTCKVQVKTTQRGHRVPGVKLSNWAIMARDPYPWFVLHVIVERGRLHRLRIAHLGKELVEAALEREFHAARAGKALHKVVWRCGSKHFRSVRRSGRALRQAIELVLGDSTSAYVTAKETWCAEAGYAEGRYTFSFSTRSGKGESAVAKLAKLVIGETTSLAPERLSLSETRFGVERPIRIGGPDATHTLQIPKPPSAGVTRVSIVRRSSGDSVLLECETYIASAVIPGLPPDEERVRIAAEGFSLVLAADGRRRRGLTINLSQPDPDMPIPLGALVGQCRAFALLTESDGGASLQVTSIAGRTFEMEVPPIPASIERRQLALVMMNVGRVCESFGVAMDFNVVPRALHRYARSWALLGVALSNRPAEIQRLSFGKVSPLPEQVDGTRAAFLMPLRVAVGNHHFGALVSLEGTARALPKGAVGLERIRASVVQRYRTAGEPIPLQDLIAAGNAERERLLAEGFTIAAMPDIAELPDVEGC